MKIETLAEVPGLQEARLMWSCPGCGNDTYGSVEEAQDDIQADPLCCYCRAKQNPQDTRNNIVFVAEDGTYHKRKGTHS